MKYYVYQRVSTEKQDLLRQEYAIDEYCKANDIEVSAENRFSDVITGKTFKRENYLMMKSQLQSGDCVIMLDLDRLGRNWDLIKQEWKYLTDNGIYIIIVNMPILSVLPNKQGQISLDMRLVQGIVFDLMCYLSQKEVEKTSIRTKEALKAKKEQGVILGAPKSISDETVQQIIELKSSGKTFRQISEITGISIASISRITRENNNTILSTKRSV